MVIDNLIQGKTRTRREFCSFYTESDPILTYMVSRLGLDDGDNILEPCAGDGVFIEKILNTTSKRNFGIEALDLNPKAIQGLNRKFRNENVKIRQADTLLDPALDLFSRKGGYYTKIIGNPPYGAWLEKDKRDILKKLYGGYVKETYTLFLQRCLDLLKENGRLVFIVPDTFLALHLHKGTREKILRNAKVEEILLLPSKFFPGVNFGYSNLCIISLVKTKNNADNKIKLVFVKNNVKDLYAISIGDYSSAVSTESIPQRQVFDSISHSFFVGGDTKVREIVNNAELTLGKLADCVTGFYSGDNKKFLIPKDKKVKGSKDYTTTGDSEADYNFLNNKDLLNGLAKNKRYIPIVKGGDRLIKNTEWFVRWDTKTVQFYKTDEKARFQNSRYYFREGIGVPMVRSSKAKAFLLQRRLFDQSVVGVFPKDKKHLNYLLAFLNSDVCSRLLKAINHTANNSANYLKKLPVIVDNNSIQEVNSIIVKFWKTKNENEAINQINRVFNRIYKSVL